MMVAYFALRFTWYSYAAAGIFATALLFSCAHVSAWPQPMPLFFLGVVLAWLAYRTQSVLAPIVVHSLFNAVACVELLLG
jgi:membrane protease YdiL (CAAX protease family)